MSRNHWDENKIKMMVSLEIKNNGEHKQLKISFVAIELVGAKLRIASHLLFQR